MLPYTTLDYNSPDEPKGFSSLRPVITEGDEPYWPKKYKPKSRNNNLVILVHTKKEGSKKRAECQNNSDQNFW